MRRIQLYVYKLHLKDKTVAYSPDLKIAKFCNQDAESPELTDLFLPDICAGRLLNQPLGWYLARMETVKYLNSRGHTDKDLLEEIPVAFAYGSREDD